MPQDHETHLALLYTSLAALESSEDVRRLLEDLCTPQELRAIAQRLAVAKLLRDANVYAEITTRTGASTATISRVRRSMAQSQGGYDAAFAALDTPGACP